MKVFVCFVACCVIAAAEPAGFRARFERQELTPPAPDSKEQTTPKSDDAPYPAAGFRPPVPFKLPSKQELPPATSYGVPDDSYGAPLNTYLAPQYGAPATTAVDDSKNATDGNSTDDSNMEPVKAEEMKANLEDNSEVISSQGAYYILLPSAQLQKVQFTTENDLRNMAYTAHLQYKNEEKGPIFVYTPAVPQIQRAAYYQFY